MCALAGCEADPAQVLRSGRAMDKWREMIRAQGGDPDAPLPQATTRETLRAPTGGYVQRLDALAVGNAAWRLGAGRARKEDPVSAAAGVLLRVKPGDRVHTGDVLLELLTDDAERVEDALAALLDAIDIGPAVPARPTLVHERISA
jgi:thymidine phosphorylase